MHKNFFYAFSKRLWKTLWITCGKLIVTGCGNVENVVEKIVAGGGKLVENVENPVENFDRGLGSHKILYQTLRTCNA